MLLPPFETRFARTHTSSKMTYWRCDNLPRSLETKGRTDKLDEEIKQLKEMVRSLTPPRCQTSTGGVAAASAGAVQNTRRLVVTK
eukprot:6034285-Amphidinium_carterae.1